MHKTHNLYHVYYYHNCNDPGEPNVTDALVLSAYCTSEEIAVVIQRIPENVDSDRFDSFAFYYNCSIEIEEVGLE